jgi:general secretion pathway protein E
LVLVITDPFNIDLQSWAEQRIDRIFSWRLARRADVAAYLSRHEETLLTMDQLISGDAQAKVERNDVEHLSIKSIAADTSPVVKLVHSTMYDALKSEASDIHLETGPTGLVIRYRIDGVLNTVGSVSGLEMAEQVISRIKIMSELDIAERRVPQDGRFKIAVRGHEVDFRVSIMPSIFGEDAVLRVLDKNTLSDQIKGLRLDHFGFDDKSLAQIRKLSNEPYGMVLVTGPTGSGKTTTLYGAISEINLGLDKIITIEDPVEYQLPGVLQIPVNEKKGLTFVRGLRSILRHDPDKIMVGEIRDSETAQIAVQSALTGHLVFTTVHANNAFDVIGRFMHMGVDTYSFVSAMNGIIAQRLVRMNCPECSVVIQPNAKLLADSGLSTEDAANMHFYEGKGCGQCRGTGYKGRKAICEILLLNDSIRELIISRQPTRLIREAARINGTRFLREAALDAVARGQTTLQEINRVTLVS